jgi:hypothetical protein
MDQIQIHRTTHKTALLNCSSYLVLMLIGLGILNLEVEAMETIFLNISCTCTYLFTYWTRKFILVRGRIASSFQLRFRVPTTIPFAPPFCGSGGAVELPTSSFYQLLCSPRILGLYLTVVWGYHLIHTDSVHDGPAGSILSTFTVMDKIRCATYKTVLLNCGSFFVLDADMFIYIELGS